MEPLPLTCSHSSSVRAGHLPESPWPAAWFQVGEREALCYPTKSRDSLFRQLQRGLERAIPHTGAPHRRVFDSFWRKERLRANDLWSGGLAGGKPEGDNSMPQSRACLKAFTARPDCSTHHGEATLPNLVYQRREGTLVGVYSACCNVPEIHISWSRM